MEAREEAADIIQETIQVVVVYVLAQFPLSLYRSRYPTPVVSVWRDKPQHGRILNMSCRARRQLPYLQSPAGANLMRPFHTLIACTPHVPRSLFLSV